jgi:hypothetical protein
VLEDSSILHEIARVFLDRGGTNIHIQQFGAVIEQLAKTRKYRLKADLDDDSNASRFADFDIDWYLFGGSDRTPRKISSLTAVPNFLSPMASSLHQPTEQV